MKNKLTLCKACGNCKYQDICEEGKVNNGQNFDKLEYCDKFTAKRGKTAEFNY